MARRRLDWRTLDDAVEDVRRLHAIGYERAGHWDLAQAAGHLAIFVHASIDGFPLRVPRVVPWVMRATGQRDRFFRLRRMPRGLPAPGRLRIAPPAAPGRDDAAAVERFAEAVSRFESFTGGHAPSPVFGELTHEQWRDFHVIHAMHHLSFLWPRDPADAPAAG